MYRYLLVLLVMCCFVLPTHAQKKGKKGEEEKKEEKDETKTIEEVTKASKRYPGLFTVYQDTIDGSVYIEVKASQLQQEYIHFAQIIDGPLDFYSRGSYSYEKIFSFNRNYERMEVVLENITSYFDPNDPLSRAADANVNKPIIYSEKIEAYSKDKTSFLIKGEPLFLKEAFTQIKPRPNPADRNPLSLKMGSLSSDKTKFIKIKSFEENTDFSVQMVYEDPSSGGFYNGWEDDLTDPRFLNIKVYNSLIKLPENDFRPRFDDPRVGYFGQRINNLTDRSATPYRDVISRWDLQKKDPEAELSEPVKPIVWWIENTTPLDFREHIKNGILAWNKAFESAGFKNVMVVNIQPDDAEWDADDIRYNVIRWTATSRSLYGGAYGPSAFNPRTGEILGADVMMDYGFIRFEGVETDLYGRTENADSEHFNGKRCSFSSELKRNFNSGRTMLRALNRDEAEENELIAQSLQMLALHEVGHTLGLNHNFMASHFLDNEKIHDKAFTSEKGMTGSVMDYSGVNLAKSKENQGLYYEVTPGPYDHWAIEFGYRVYNEQEEEAALNQLLSNSGQPELAFGNDADAMRGAGGGIDPRVQTWDQTSDPIQYAIDRFKMVDESLKSLFDKVVEENESYQVFRNSYYILTGDWNRGITTISKFHGGVYINRAFHGQAEGTKPFTPVPYALQKRAMEALNTYAFSPTAMKTPSEVYNYLQNQRRGFDHFSSTEDPKIMDRILSTHKSLLAHMLHQNKWQRIVDSEQYGNKYSLTEYATDLTNGIFKADLNGAVNYQRQNLQTEYLIGLTDILESKNYNHVSKAVAFNQINAIQKMLSRATSSDESTKGHRAYLGFLINQAMDKD
jgi:hypothetical protein